MKPEERVRALVERLDREGISDFDSILKAFDTMIVEMVKDWLDEQELNAP